MVIYTTLRSLAEFAVEIAAEVAGGVYDIRWDLDGWWVEVPDLEADQGLVREWYARGWTPARAAEHIRQARALEGVCRWMVAADYAAYQSSL